MRKWQRLTVADVRSVFYLLDELRDMGGSAGHWKRQMLCSLCRLIGGQVGISVVTPAQQPTACDLTRTVDIGWAGEKDRSKWIAYGRTNNVNVERSDAEITRLIVSGGPFFRRRQQLCPDPSSYSSDRIPITGNNSAVEDVIFSYRRLAHPQRHHWLYFLRPWNDRPFAVCQRRLVRLFHEELGRILDQDAIRVAQAGSLVNLSPRQRQTLDLLATGLSEKQVARKLVCSQQTIHGYVKELHHRFGVHARAELLVKRSQQDQLTQLRFRL